MLEPREADLPALFLAFVVLPLVTYILLGKWSETAKKKERISLLAQLAAEEAFRAEAMNTTLHIPVRTSPKINVHQCARCSAPATTRCSRCKSVRYCSGKCQIIHWRHGHKLECQRLETSSFSLKTMAIEESSHQRVFQTENMSSFFFRNNSKEPMQENSYSNKPHCTSSVTAATTCGTVDTSQISPSERKLLEPNSEVTQREETVFLGSFEENSQATSTSSSSVIPSREASIRQKLGNGDSVALTEETCRNHSFHGRTIPKSAMHETCKLRSKAGNIVMPESNSSTSTLPYSDQSRRNGFAIGTDFISNKGNFLGNKFTDEFENLNSERISHKGSAKSKSKVHPLEPQVAVSPISGLKKASKEYPCSGKEGKGRIADESKIPQTSADVTVPAQSNNGLYDMEVMHMVGLKKSLEIPRPEATGASTIARRKMKVLFPYEEFMKFFQCEAWDISPRGLLNCGNSCYANAVLQCLTCTKPLNIYLLGRSHSRNCHGKDWCLMCELEQHVMMLREFEGPLSPSRILSHMRSISFQMGGGSQEDAHEFLRLLVTSMQSICLDGVGGEKKVDPRLQETTFIQHTFGGCLRSKVKCLRCHHESERYERIMDLTLEILGWVESLEDALTQFTACEDLDGENMYRCGRCAAYVRARKQLRIHEAPNILTIVLKRFQKGSYGKINKCITFPEMLDMIPFMTGTGDSPPLYMLYAVVVHLDTQNASFSGHYVSYVKDLQGTWFRIDDTEVQPVPMSQVMSEGAYILFYSRSYPRTPRASIGKTTTLQSLASTRHCFSKTQKPTRQEEQNTASEAIFTSKRPSPSIPDSAMDFSDATTSSDWSLFTSSDESSFTTESTRDSFSTVDYTDTFNSTDPILSIFNTYTPEYPLNGNVPCRSFSHCKPDTRFLSEGKSFVLDSYLSGKLLSNRVQSGKNPSRFSVLPSA